MVMLHTLTLSSLSTAQKTLPIVAAVCLVTQRALHAHQAFLLIKPTTPRQRSEMQCFVPNTVKHASCFSLPWQCCAIRLPPLCCGISPVTINRACFSFTLAVCVDGEGSFSLQRRIIAQEKGEVEMREGVQKFDRSSLKHVEPQEKTVLPSPDEIVHEKTEVELRERIGSFSKETLKHTETQEKNVLPTEEEIKHEKTEVELRERIGSFSKESLKHAETEEKNVLPTEEEFTFCSHTVRLVSARLNRIDLVFSPRQLSEIEHEKTEVELRERIGSFSKETLKHAETEEKNVLPTEEDIGKEKTEAAICKGIEEFKKGDLKHTQVKEKNPLPPAEAIEAEKKEEEFKQSIEGFNRRSLKHAQTTEKNPLPTKEVKFAWVALSQFYRRIKTSSESLGVAE
ncbi:hypothetical protein BaRGS_00012396 [Batillaria attramentaria]|uniref:Uncharacterized protein n=1 Tax=Batillaria attramentaria TaxID=370345 RepID=A0ABD0LAP5_9CAEN